MTTMVKPPHRESNYVSGGDRNTAVAVYLTHTDAEEAVKDLERSGFDMTKLSIAGKDYETDEHFSRVLDNFDFSRVLDEGAKQFLLSAGVPTS